MKKTAIFCMIAVMAMAMMGFGFAKWSDTVYISHAVNTGEVEVGIVTTSVDDPDTTEDPVGSGATNDEQKHVGTTSLANETFIENLGSQGYYETTTLTVDNAYPWYKSGSTMEFANLGTIPVKVESITATETTAAGEANVWDYMFITDYTITDVDTTTNAATTVVEVSGVQHTWNDIIAAVQYYQLHPDHKLVVDFDFEFCQDIDGVEMPQLATNSVELEVIASQWNEVVGTPATPIS